MKTLKLAALLLLALSDIGAHQIGASLSKAAVAHVKDPTSTTAPPKASNAPGHALHDDPFPDPAQSSSSSEDAEEYDLQLSSELDKKPSKPRKHKKVHHKDHFRNMERGRKQHQKMESKLRKAKRLKGHRNSKAK